jgi:hypothetical protein
MRKSTQGAHRNDALRVVKLVENLLLSGFIIVLVVACPLIGISMRP